MTNFHIPVLGEGRDEGAEGDGARVGEQARDFADAADILVAVRRRESEVAAEAVVAADVVTVEAVGGDAPGHEVLLQREGDGRLPRPREPGEPAGNDYDDQG